MQLSLVLIGEGDTAAPAVRGHCELTGNALGCEDRLQFLQGPGHCHSFLDDWLDKHPYLLVRLVGFLDGLFLCCLAPLIPAFPGDGGSCLVSLLDQAHRRYTFSPVVDYVGHDVKMLVCLVIVSRDHILRIIKTDALHEVLCHVQFLRIGGVFSRSPGQNPVIHWLAYAACVVGIRRSVSECLLTEIESDLTRINLDIAVLIIREIDTGETEKHRHGTVVHAELHIISDCSSEAVSCCEFGYHLTLILP